MDTTLCPPSPHTCNVFYLIKDVQRLGHPQHFDAVLYADNVAKSVNAVGSRSDSVFHVSHQFASSFIPAPF